MINAAISYLYGSKCTAFMLCKPQGSKSFVRQDFKHKFLNINSDRGQDEPCGWCFCHKTLFGFNLWLVGFSRGKKIPLIFFPIHKRLKGTFGIHSKHLILQLDTIIFHFSFTWSYLYLLEIKVITMLSCVVWRIGIFTIIWVLNSAAMKEDWNFIPPAYIFCHFIKKLNSWVIKRLYKCLKYCKKEDKKLAEFVALKWIHFCH